MGKPMKRVFSVLALVVIMVLPSTGTSSASPASAYPGDDVGTFGGCIGKICGSVMNESNHVIWAIRDWGNDGPKPGTEWRPLVPGGDPTPPNQDWDGVYVECNASGRIATWTFPGIWVWSDFTLRAGYAMKFSTNDDVHVRNQSC